MTRRAAVRFLVAILILMAAGSCAAAAPLEIAVTQASPQGIYAPGELVTWHLAVRGDGAARVNTLHYVLKQDGLVVLREGDLPLTEGKATLTGTLQRPGTILVEMTAKVGDKDLYGKAAAAFNPTAIRPSAPVPDDFDAFWRAKLAELAKVPVNAFVEPAPTDVPGIEYYKVRMDNIRGSHIYGQLAKPKGNGKYPALLIVQWAGVYPLSPGWVTWRAKSGWLVLDIEAHDLPFDKPESFYDDLSKTTLAHYTAIGNDDRETSYFLRMYLSCYRAADYLAHRPDWDGRVLVVTGGSQGGLQTIVTAALYPKITAAVASVPAGCDDTGYNLNRAPGWPFWADSAEGKDKQKVIQTSRYFDAVNFASRVRCPTLVGLGLVDTTCPAPGTFAMSNQLRGPKEIVVMPKAGHNDGPHDAYNEREQAWMDALVQGKPAPVNHE